MNDLKAEDLLVRKGVKKDVEIIKKVENAPVIPSGYITVKLSSLGKLGFPAIVHVRDYKFDEALLMAEMNENNTSEVLSQILNNVIFEDVDIKKAHRQDVLEILLNIYVTWYSPTIESMRYYINPDLEGEKLTAKENISVATIPICNIKTTPISDDVKVPFTIKRKDFEAGFVLAKLENEITAIKFVEEKYAKQDQENQELKKKIESKNYTTAEFSEYHKYVSNKGKDFLKVMQSMLIDSLNGKKLETLEEKMEAVDEIPLNMWTVYNNTLKSKFNFGVNPEVEFECSVTHKPITRRFQFREIYFIPTMVNSDDSGFDVSFS